MLAVQQQSLTVWRAVRTDVAAIARAMGVQSSRAMPAFAGVAVRASSAAPSSTPAATTARGGSASSGPSGARPATVATRTSRAANAGGRAEMTSVAVAQPRAANGRFVKGGGAPKAGAPGSGGGDDGSGGGFLRDAAGRLTRAAGSLAQATGGLEQVDATVAASKEIADVAAPLGRGLFGLFGRSAERKKERWYQRIWKALTSPIGAKGGGAQPAAAGGPGMLQTMMGGMFGGIGGLLSKVPGLLLTVFTRILAPVAALWGAWNVGQWIGSKINDWLNESGVMPKVFDAFDAIRDAFGAAWETVKGAVDTIGTTVSEVWSKITDTVKAAVDGLASIPDKIGEFFRSIDESIRGIPVIGKAYAAAVDGAKAAIGDAKKGYGEGESGKADGKPTNAAQAAGRDVGQVVRGAKDVGTQVGAGWNTARGNDSDAPEAATTVQKVARSVGMGAGKAVNAVTGNANANMMLEAGRASGMGDKELANFMGQNAHESGNFRVMSENLNYSSVARIRSAFGKNKAVASMSDAEVAGLVNNPDALANKVYGGRMGNTEAGDGYKFRGRGFTQLTGKDNYAAAGKALGLDLANNPDLAADPANAAKISAWYWKKNVSARGAGEDVTAATKAVNGGLNGLEDRKVKTAEWASKIAAANVATPKVPSVPSASVPPLAPPQVPPTPDAGIPERLNGSGGSQAVQVQIADKTRQDVGNRRIAHLASGGISAA
ncbi:glycoside hydrolase family 19 protein [Variovorax ureilyticus]|uniref:Glycoside hydrolase family 19 protein n=1 Tax=Variovorax ureilyticus TaxID=1836198 RepID=A0ABU8VDU1_9BURK